MDVLLIGASVRAAAFSAMRAGLRPRAIDLFADRDLLAVCPVRQVPPGSYPEGLAGLAREEPSGPWLYTGALENRPAVVEQIARDRPLWGNDAACLIRVRDPFAVTAALRAADVCRPEVRDPRSGAPPGRWLAKPIAGAGGSGIRRVAGAESSKPRLCQDRGFEDSAPATRRDRVYLQEFIAGESRAGLFLADTSGCRLLGVTRQLIGETWLHARPFRYSGSIGPLALTTGERSGWERLGAEVAAFAGLRGLFGVDAIVRDGVPWPVEVNPRYTASVEVIEYATGLQALRLHREVFDRASVEPSGRRVLTGEVSSALRLDARPAVVGKAIWYAPRLLTVPDSGPWDAVLTAWCDHDNPPAFADIPSAGQEIAAGRPVVTAFASANSLDECERRLRAAARELDACLLR